MSDLQRPRGELEVFSGTAHPELALEVAMRLDRPLGRLNVSRFPDGEVHVQIEESVRGKTFLLFSQLALL